MLKRKCKRFCPANVCNTHCCQHPNTQWCTSVWSHQTSMIRVGGEDDTQNHHYHPENQKGALSFSSPSCSWQNVCWSTAENFIGLEDTPKKYKQINEYQQWEINSFKCFIQLKSLCSQIHCQDENLEGFCQTISNYSALWKHKGYSTPWWEKTVYI